MKSDKTKTDISEVKEAAAEKELVDDNAPLPNETNGPKGPEPTRYGDWEQKGRCTDF